jgi:uncharacterized protein (DUF1330 family)
MAAYLIADILIRDAAGYEEYRNRISAVIAFHGGRYLARGGRCTLLEGDREPGRVVVLEFPSMEKLNAFYGSSQYAALKDLRKRTTISHIYAVEGIASLPES